MDIPEMEDRPCCSSFMQKAGNHFMKTKGLLPALSYCFCLTFMVFPGLIQDTTFEFQKGWNHE